MCVVCNVESNMKIRVPRGIRKDQIYLVLILGVGTGIYGWNSLLREYAKEREKELQLNEVINRIAPKYCLVTKSKNLLAKRPGQLGFLLISGGICILGTIFYIRPWIKRRKATQAEEFANFIYEQRKKRTLQQNKD